MILKKNGEIEYLQSRLFKNYENIVNHAFFTKKGGYCTGEYPGFNLSTDSCFSHDEIEKNRKKILETIGPGRLFEVKQVHGNGVVVLRSEDENTLENFDNKEGDAVITDIPGVALLIKTADCQSVILFDSEKKVIANIHSGWRGSVQNICGDTVLSMQKEFGSDPADIIACVGPSLGPCCAEFVNFMEELPEKFHQFKDDENNFDFWAITEMQLIDSGVKNENISLSKRCTMCSGNDFFSYRKNKSKGRLANIIMLLES